ncbi:MAG: hypothetical protein AAGK97_16290, partial [Bacteroidota bacterium]
FWTTNASALNAFIISTGPVETAYALDVPTSGWASIDIPLSSFNPVDLTDIIQLKFDGDGDVFLDNIFFFKEVVDPVLPTEPAPIPTFEDDYVISVFSDTYTNVEGTNLNPDWGQATIATEIDVQGNNTLQYVGLNYQGIELGAVQDVSEMEFLHLDFWTANATALNAFIISTGPIETAVPLNVPTSGWMSVDIPLSSFSPVDLRDVIQLKFDGDGDVYLDNILFYKEKPTTPQGPAPNPMDEEANVISIFSDAFTNVEGSNLNPNWGQATVVTELEIEGNNTLMYTGLNYQGIELGSAQDVSEMEFLHINYWTANSTDLKVFLISSGPVEVSFPLDIPTSGWGSAVIPLSNFNPVNDTDIIQFKFEGNGDIYLDNIYFFKEEDIPTSPVRAAPVPT